MTDTHFFSETGIDYWRQLGLVPMDKVKEQVVTIIGCGGIGSFVAPALAKLGIVEFVLYDGDSVESHNIPNQNFTMGDVGVNKAVAIKNILTRDFGKELTITVYDRMWDGDELSDIVVSAVDSMTVRHAIWDECALNPAVSLLVDGRIGGFTVNVLTVKPADVSDMRKYEAHLYKDEAVKDLPCTERAIIDVAYLVTALIVRAVRSYIKDNETLRLTASMAYPQILEV